MISVVGTTRTVYIGNVFEAEIGQNDTPSNDPIGTGYCDFHCPNQVFLPVVMGDQNGTMPITSGPTYHSHPAKPTGGIKWRSYYYSAGQRIATRETTSAGMGDPFYLLSDHLGSITVTVDKNGSRTGELFYKAWGEIDTNRLFGNTPTRRGYTGQYQAEAGLNFYQSRFYDPSLGRFIQADTLIPDPGDPLAWDRFAYVKNNALKYTDPSGHFAWVAVGALVGAGIAYGLQVYSNYQNGVTGVDAWTHVDAGAVVGGALLGAGAVLFAPAVVALAGDVAVGAGLVTGSTSLYLAGNSLYHASTLMEANIVYAAPGRVLPTVNYNPATTSEIIDHDFAAQANGKPSVLTYTSDGKLADANGRAARATLQSSSVYDRHEYPYASTYEGGRGSYVGYVDPTQNARHGQYLSRFYQQNGNVNGFKFFVDVGYYSWTSWPWYNYYNYMYGFTSNNHGGATER